MARWADEDGEYKGFGVSICPVCGDKVSIVGEVPIGLIAGSCGDNFGIADWNDLRYIHDDEFREMKDKQKPWPELEEEFKD